MKKTWENPQLKKYLRETVDIQAGSVATVAEGVLKPGTGTGSMS